MRKGCEALEKCEEMVSKLGLFSASETKDDISTSNLKYLLVWRSVVEFYVLIHGLVEFSSGFFSFIVLGCLVGENVGERKKITGKRRLGFRSLPPFYVLLCC